MTQLPPLIKGCCPEGKRRVLLTVSYDGTAYAGWQRQQNALAVQQVLEEALRKLTGEATLTVTGSSRTDAGVHALGQRVHFDTASRIPPDKFPFALNTCLPADIRVLDGRYVPAAFHARFDAAGKRYTYRIHNAPHASALYRHLCAHVPVPLQMEPMERSLQTMMETEVTNGLIPRKFNQALMELGAMVCVPNGAPHCPECPWYGFCEARLQDKIDTIPVKTRAKARRIEERTVFVIRDGEHVALRKRPAKGLLAGLYELLNVSGILEQQEALEYVKNQGFSPIRIQALAPARHIFSHVEWHMHAYVVLVEETTAPKENILFTEAQKAVENYAVPSAFSAYWNAIKMEIKE